MITQKQKFIKYMFGCLVILGLLSLVLFWPLDILFYQKLPFIPFLKRAIFVLLFACVLCLYRIMRGPTAADRAVALDMLGVLIIGFCVIIGVSTGRSWYIDIAIAWALQSFIATLALAKFLEGKSLDD